MKTSIVNSLFVVLALFANQSTALPAGSPVEAAKRSFVSGSTTCYYACPATQSNGNWGFFAHNGNDSGKATCTYIDGTSASDCLYDLSTGILANPANPICTETKAPVDRCGGAPPSSDTDTYWKREVPARELTELEQKLKDRQWKRKV